MALPNYVAFSVSIEVKFTLIQSFFLYDWQNFLATLEKFLKSVKIKPLSQRSFGTKQVKLILILVGCANDHAVAIEASEWSRLEISEDNHFPFHLLNWDIFLET